MHLLYSETFILENSSSKDSESTDDESKVESDHEGNNEDQPDESESSEEENNEDPAHADSNESNAESDAEENVGSECGANDSSEDPNNDEEEQMKSEEELTKDSDKEDNSSDVESDPKEKESSEHSGNSSSEGESNHDEEMLEDSDKEDNGSDAECETEENDDSERGENSSSTDENNNEGDNENDIESQVEEDEDSEPDVDLSNLFILNANHDEDHESEDDDASELVAKAIEVASGHELESEALHSIQDIATNSAYRKESLHAKYILCAHAAQHSGFVEPSYFANLSGLLSTDNVIIRQCVMWAFASILPCKNVLNPFLIRILYRSLKDETLGWSISYLFRKMSEYDKYIPMVSDVIWIAMANSLFDRNLSEQVRTTMVHTLYNIFKIRKWISGLIKMKYERLVQTDDIPQRLFVATVQALHWMVMTGATLEPETLTKLRALATTSNGSTMECVHDLLDFLDNKRILSNMANSMSDSRVKKELTATQNTTVSRSEEESIEPTAKFLSLDHLLSTTGHLDRQFNSESEPTDVDSGSNQAWYRTTLQEVNYLASLAKDGNLKDEDFIYLVSKFDDGVHWSTVPWRSRESTYEMIADAFRDAANAKQALPKDAIGLMIQRLSGTNAKIHRTCAEGLLIAVKNRQMLDEDELERIERKLKSTNDTQVKQHLIELYALYVSKGHHFKLDLESIEDDLLDQNTCETASYLFFKAAAVEKRTFNNRTMAILIQVATSDEYKDEVRDHCLWAIAYSIKESEDKTTISSEIIDNLSGMLMNLRDQIKQIAAVGLCLLCHR